jgi:hypothetical protein
MASTANSINNYPPATGTRTYIGSAGIDSGADLANEMGMPAAKKIQNWANKYQDD